MVLDMVMADLEPQLVADNMSNNVKHHMHKKLK